MPASPRKLRFGVFEADLETGELRKSGIRIKVQEKPFRILALLLDRRGETVTREELRENLWHADTFVDYDRSLGTAMGKLRQALGDSAENPRFIETITGRGYRFLVPVRAISPVDPALAPCNEPRPSIRRYGPSAAITVLVGVMAIGLLAWRGPHPASPVPIKSVLVLPLENLSGDPQQEYFVDGMTDELITDMAKLGSMRVISRTSAMRLKKNGRPLAQIARELNVDDVVEGSVVRSGNRVRITAQLIDAAADRHLWAESYDRELSDVLAVQSEIAQAIAGQVRASLMPQQAAPAAGHRISPAAHEAYLKGRYHLDKGAENDIRKGIEDFELALAKDAAYAPAFAGLADSYVALADFYLPPNEMMPKAKVAAVRALQIDERLAEAHTSLGAVRFIYDWDWIAAEREFKRALELNPNSTDAHVWYGNFLAQMSRHAEAAKEIDRAEQLDPLSVNVYLNAGWVYYMARQTEQLARELKKAVDLDLELPVAHSSVWLGYVPKGAATPAIRSLEKEGVAKESSPLILATLAAIHATEGRPREASRVLERLNGISKQRYVCPYEMAAAHATLGRRKEAFEMLAEAYRQRSICLPALKADPRFDPLRSDPRLQELLQRMSFP